MTRRRGKLRTSTKGTRMQRTGVESTTAGHRANTARVWSRMAALGIGRCGALLLLALLAATAPPALAASPTQESSVPADAPEVLLQQRVEKLAADRASTEAALAVATAAADQPLVDHMQALLAIYDSIGLQLGVQQTAMQRAATLAEETADVQRRLDESAESPPEEPRLADYDAVRDALDAERAVLAAAAETIRRSEQQLAAARELLDERRRTATQARADLEALQDPIAVVGQQRTVVLAESRARLADETREVRRLELENLRNANALDQREAQLIERRQARILERLVVSDEDFAAPLKTLQARKVDLEHRRNLATSDYNLALGLHEAARQKQMASGELVFAAEVDARRVELFVANERKSLIESQIQRIDKDLEVWPLRIEILSGQATVEMLTQAQVSLEAEVRELELDERALAQRVTGNLGALEIVRSEQENATDPGARRWLDIRRMQRESLVSDYALEVQDISRALALRRRVLDEVDERTENLGIRGLLEGLWQALVKAWEFPFYQVGGTGVPITPRKIVTALVLIIVGLILSKLARRFLRTRILPRFQLEPGVSTIYETLIFYLLLFTAALVAMEVLEIPLTAFTVLGGALAIGVGFGSQNLVNNFISGLIIMAERPVRVGDLIEVDETYGIVERIGARSTTVMTSENINMVIPNSSFLENNVVNWTLSNDVIRTDVLVGVAYGSPTREVDRLLHRAVNEHGKILDHPEPIVIFDDFGNDSLQFRVYFWLRARTTMERRRVQSDVRYRIDNLFREAGITIAFPQRDVHFDAERPLSVRVTRGTSGDPEALAGTAGVRRSEKA